MMLPHSKNRRPSYHFILSLLNCTIRRFKIPTLSNGLTESRNSVLIHKLHEILRPFLLRRLKVDVERSLPPKKEYILYAPLSLRQLELYDAIVKGSLRGLLAGARPGGSARERDRERIAREIEEDEKMGRVGTRTRKSQVGIEPAAKSVSEVGAEYAFRAKCASLYLSPCTAR
jgi:SNF2 family DNA or RNA helicase